MNKGLKALETIDRYVDKDYDYCQRGDYDEDYKVVEQELQRLESIENAKPSVALELVGCLKDHHLNAIPYYDWLNDIEKYILKAKEQEELFDYLIKFIKNVEVSDNGICYISFSQS